MQKNLSNLQQDISRFFFYKQLTYPSRENLENCTVYLGTTLRGRLGERSLRGDRSLERFRVGERSLDLLRSLSLSRLHKHRQNKAWACTANKNSQYLFFSSCTYWRNSTWLLLTKLGACISADLRSSFLRMSSGRSLRLGKRGEGSTRLTCCGWGIIRTGGCSKPPENTESKHGRERWDIRFDCVKSVSERWSWLMYL